MKDTSSKKNQRIILYLNSAEILISVTIKEEKINRLFGRKTE